MGVGEAGGRIDYNPSCKVLGVMDMFIIFIVAMVYKSMHMSKLIKFYMLKMYINCTNYTSIKLLKKIECGEYRDINGTRLA